MLRVGKYTPGAQGVGDLSVRSMLEDLVGVLLLSCVICKSPPEQFTFKAESAGEGLLIGRDLLAKAFGVPVEHVHYLPKGTRMNVDDMVCMCHPENSFC